MQPRLSLPALLVLAVLIVPASQALAVSAGSNLYIDYNQEVDVPYSGFAGQYFLNEPLIHSPWYGPFFKLFESPITDTLDPILLDAEQPYPQRVTESYYLPPILAPILTLPVAGWHEEIYTDGWEWVIPGDPRFPWLFPEDQTLVTKDGKPHPSEVIHSVLTVYEPEKLLFEFPPIHEGETLGIHKALLWVGTPGNRVWGDNVMDDGAYFDESTIRVFEYPLARDISDPPGDLNNDGFVGIEDLNNVLSHWNKVVPPANPVADIAGPLGHYADGYVGIEDLNVVLRNWNARVTPGESTQSPEPSVGILLILGMSCVIRRR